MTALPRMIHPATLTDYSQPLYVSPAGRKFFPIGGASDDPPPGDPPKDEPPKDEPPKDDPPKNEPGKGDDGKTDEERGYPLNTPESEMTTEQKLAYRTVQMRKHQAVAEKLTKQGVTPEVYAEQMKELEELRAKNMTESEKAIAEAKEQGRQEALGETNAKVIQAHVDAFIGARGVDLEKNPELAATLDALNLEKFVQDGDVDTDKLVKVLTNLVPDPDKGGKRWPDMGGGKRGGTASSKGVAAGADLFEQVHGSKSK